MKNTILSVSLVGALFFLILQLPVVNISVQAQEQLAAVSYCTNPENPQQTCFLLRTEEGGKPRCICDPIGNKGGTSIADRTRDFFVKYLFKMRGSAKSRSSRGARNNNPGNIEAGRFMRSQGCFGSDRRFAICPQPEMGIAAHYKLLMSYSRRGCRTIQCWVYKWAPPTENRSSAYVRSVSYWSGIHPNKVIDINNPIEMSKIVVAMGRKELGGFPYSYNQLNRAVQKVYGKTLGSISPSNTDFQSYQNMGGSFGFDVRPQKIAQSFWQSSAGQTLSRAIGNQPEVQQRPVQQPQQAPRQQPLPPRLLPQVNTQGQSPLGQANASWLDRLLGRVQSPVVQSTPRASLTCDASDERVYLRWSCPNGTTISKGLGTLGAVFNTNGAGAGSVNSAPVSGAEYILQCIKDHQLYAEAKCTTPIREPAFNNGTLYDSVPDGVVMSIEYDRGDIIWATLGTRACQLLVNDVRRLGTNGSVTIGEPKQDVLIKLECKTIHGDAVKYKKIVVE